MLLYTANIGGYDKLQVTRQPGFDFMDANCQVDGFSKVRSARFYKINLPTYDGDISIWLDANTKINCDLKTFVNKWLTSDVDMVAMEHGRDCIYEEMDACLERRKDTFEHIERQRQFYLNEGFPRHQGMIGSGILIRRHIRKVYTLINEWWKYVEEYSHRDQLSFNYALWRLKKDINFKIKLAYIPYSVFGNEFELVPHGKN